MLRVAQMTMRLRRQVGKSDDAFVDDFEALLASSAQDLADTSDRTQSLMERLPTLVDAAFGERRAEALLSVHQTLFLIYELTFLNPMAPAVQHEHRPWLARIRNTLEEAWLRCENREISEQLPPVPVASDFDSLCAWLIDQAKIRTKADAELESFMAERASLAAMREFVRIDMHLNYRFYDVLALAQLHYSEAVKAEIAGHMWDECGRGDSKHAHTRLFSDLALRLDLDPVAAPCWQDWRPYAGYNLYLLFGLNRRHYFKSIGSLTMPELFDPDRDRAIIAGAIRLGFDPEGDFGYYNAHIEGDEQHGPSWLKSVVGPILSVQPDAGPDIAFGAALRMEYMRRFNRYLLGTLTVDGA